MSSIGSSRPLILAQSAFKRDVIKMFRDGVEQMRAALARLADANGKLFDERAARATVRQIASDLFTGRDEHAFAADGITPQAPYPRILNKWLAWAVYQAVKQQESWLKRHTPEDVFRGLQNGRRRIISEQKSPPQPLPIAWRGAEIAEQTKIFEPNPLAEIDPARQWVPPHQWTDERGYRLSDRIWRTDMMTREKIDALLAKGLQEGKGALELAQALEAYLVPGREGIRTLKPYGRRFMPGGASADAMRLARTEIARAFNSAAYIAGYVNPYTEGMDWSRSANGDPSCPICGSHATIDMSGQRVRPPFPKNSADVPPPHPHCMCFVTWTMMDDPTTMTANLRAMMQDSQQELDINPSDAWQFTHMLIGDALMQILVQLGLKPVQPFLF